MHILARLLVTGITAAAVNAHACLITDAHIHYDRDVWDKLPPADALKMLRHEDICRALVSATPTEGAEKLYRADPGYVIPLLRPYKSWRHRYLWFNDPDLSDYLLAQLERVPYRGIGEFHVFGEDVDSSPVEDMIELARDRGLVLHPHTDLEGMRILLSKAPDIVVLWAHGGFDVPVDTLRALMIEYPKLYIDLTLRDGMLDDGKNLTPQWRAFLEAFHTRFVVGMDTYKPGRWAELPELVAETRDWLNQLPAAVSADIARHNLDRLFPENGAP